MKDPQALLREKKNLTRRQFIKKDINKMKERELILLQELKRVRAEINAKYEEFARLKEGIDD